ncbi:MAG: lipid-A-disaccharide synthase [Muribaculaceae bacterium]|nr:lipid-A-disaccharide synthase [Muribaculaceae bacterium]
MKYFLIAGEASGDLHGAQLIEALRQADPDASFAFLGGDLMAQAAGTVPVIHYREMAFMGFSEVIRHLPQVLGNLKEARRAMLQFAPDAFIPVDYPSFNFKVAKTAAKAGIPVYYFISPKLWAWKAWRIKSIKRYVRKVLAIFPFEPAWYAERGYKADYVGNPSVAEIDAAMARVPSREDFLKQHKLRDRPIIALLPGSRRSEVLNNLPVMIEAAHRYAQYRAVVAGAPGLDDEFYASITKLPVVRDATYPLLRHAEAALVTSGTATLEAALAGVPQVVCYRSNGSKLTHDIMKRVLKINHVSLPNIIAGRGIVPEMLLHRCTPELVTEQLTPLLRKGSEEREAQLNGYREMRRILGEQDAAATAARIITDDLKKEEPAAEL